VFGEGASVLAVPEATRAENSQQTRASHADDKRQAITPEQLQRRAQSRGLWTNSDEVPIAPTTNPRAGTLPRAVVGTPSTASAANTNYRSPAIGNPDSEPAPAAPLAAAQEQLQAADISDPHTLSVHPESAREPSLRVSDPSKSPQGMDGDTLEIPLDQLRDKQPDTARPAARAQTSPPNTTVWLALILIAAVVAVWFIGAAIGLWSLPWGKSHSGRTLNKAIPAKSLPEMHAVAPQEPTAAPAVPSAAPPVEAKPETALTTGTTPQPTAAPTAAAAPAEEQAAAVMEAEEAAPLRAPAISGNNLDDLMDPPSPEIAPTLISARAELRAGRPKDAEALLRPLLEKYPDDHHIAEAMAQTLLARGAAVEAVGFAQRVVKKQPKRASYRVLLGDALRRAGDEPSAKLAYKDALALDPKLREAQRRLKNRKLTGSP
jgi:tetratricopeptide (TPR) repeat protein